MKNNLRVFSARIQNLGALLGMLLLLVPQEYIPTTTPTEEPTALVLVTLQNETRLEELAALAPTFYLRFDAPQGAIQFILPAGTSRQEALFHRGFEFEALDSDIQGKSFYQLYGLPEKIRQAESLCLFLISHGRQAVVRASPDEVEHLERLGLMVQELVSHPLVAPAEADLGVDRSPSLPSSITPSPLVEEMVSQVSSSTLNTYVGNLSGEWPVTISGDPYTIYTRYSYSGTPILKATRFVYEHFQSLGIPVAYHYYNAGGGERRNVIAEQSGVTQSQRIFMVVAHLDSTSESPNIYAPGADDNASGSAAVMAIADILGQYDFGCTLRYALFTGEEQGYFGSTAYASDAQELNEDIEGVLNLDMIAFNTPGSSPTLELHTRPGNAGDLVIANLFADSVPAYSIDLEPEIYQDGERFSDHASFWDYHFHAIMAIEDWSDHTPDYHTTGDQLETLNLSYYTEFIKAALATFAHMGCLLEGRLEGTVSDAVSGDPLPGATVEAVSDGGRTYSTTTQTGGYYQLTLPPDSYTVTFSAANHRNVTVEDVQIIDDQTTTLDRSLQPCIAVRDVDFSSTPYRPLVDETVTFTAVVGGGELPFDYSWDFNDGDNDSGQQVTHAFQAKGVYTVELTVDNVCAVPKTVLHPVFVEVELIYFPLVRR